MSIGLLIVFGVLLGIAFIFCGIEYLRDYLVRGDYEDQIKFYTNRFSFNKTLDKKMKYFPNQNMVWLKVFMNLVLPGILVIHTYDYINTCFLGGAEQSLAIIDAVPLSPFAKGIIYAVIACLLLSWLLAFWLTIAIRFIDKLSFILLILFSIVEIVHASLLIFSIGLPASLVLCGFLFLNIGYFVKRRELFWKSTRELKELYSLDD